MWPCAQKMWSYGQKNVAYRLKMWPNGQKCGHMD